MAVRIATGAPVPAGASAVLRREDGITDDGVLRSAVPVADGRDIRPRGQECTAGMTLLPAGATVTPAVLGLAAGAGHDALLVHRQPSVRLLVTGGELLDSGVPGDGWIRDALSPMIGPWLAGHGAAADGSQVLGDQAGPLLAEVRHCPADVIIATGGTAGGPADLLHDVLREAGARLVVDSVAVRPGHPMLLAELPGLPGGRPRWLVGLPGNPLAAIAGLVTLARPLLRRLGGHPAPAARFLAIGREAAGHPRDTHLVPVAESGGQAVPLPFGGPAMLRGVAAGGLLAVIPPGGARAGTPVEVVPVNSVNG
jgi:molybdopterin molybdotransferase